MKPMKKILVVLCTFGLSMGAAFPFYSGFFIIWVPEKKMAFILGCLIAGLIVGVFGYLVIKIILKQIDNYYKNILMNKLGIDSSIIKSEEKDILLVMRKEFEQLLDRFAEVMKKEKEYLENRSITDGLTSLYNHRYYFEYFNKKVSEGCGQVVILFCDIDNFKIVNDTYGHLTGDIVLKNIGCIIKDLAEESDCIFRYGGEEFVVLLGNCNKDEAYSIAERLRMKVMNSNLIYYCSNGNPVTISIGIASYPHDAKNAEELIDKADKAMYCAKRSGRNQCKVYDASQELISLIRE